MTPRPPRKPDHRLVLNPQPGWTVGLAIATALEGLPGYDGATLADLTGQLTQPMPEGPVEVEATDDPLDGVRAILADLAPGHTLAPDDRGSLRLRGGEARNPGPDAEVTDDGAA